MAEEVLTLEEAAGLLKVPVGTIRRWLREGRIPVVKLGGQKTGWRVLRSDLDRFVRERRHAGECMALGAASSGEGLV